MKLVNKFTTPPLLHFKYSSVRLLQPQSLNSPTNSLSSAFSLTFDATSLRSWLSAITDLSHSGDHRGALSAFSSLYRQPLHSLSSLNPFLLPLLRSAALLPSLASGRQLHLISIRLGFVDHNPFLASALIHMYSRCLEIHDARRAFDEARFFYCLNSVVWTSMISGYVQNKLPHFGFQLFKVFLAEEGKEAVDAVAVVSALSACSQVLEKNATKWVHGLIVKVGLVGDVGVCNTLMNAYAKGSGDMEVTRKVFDEMLKKDVISWNSIIALYAQSGFSAVALNLYSQMSSDGSVRSNDVTFSAVLVACAHACALQSGKRTHNQVIRLGLEQNVYIGTSVVDMYCKCGRVEMAKKAFDRMKERNIFTWSALVAGYGIHGRGREALEVFDKMISSGLKPNYITFVSVLAACNHAGLIKEGKHWFQAMKSDFAIEPGVEHYSCMVDLLGSGGYLDEAYGLIKDMKIQPDSMVWGSLLRACKTHKNVELVEIASRNLFRLDPRNHGYYVLLSNMYVNTGRWKDAEKIQNLINKKAMVKPPGYSMVELKGAIHTFLVGDARHPQHKEVYKYLNKLSIKMQEAGYVPDTSSVLHDVDEEEKRKLLWVHSEKLAVCFAIINTVPGTTIHVIKNLRMCGDCHSAIKLIAKLLKREIVVRDSHRFHQFKDGFCTCEDSC
ncbi:tetratricopeptide repeat (TPR)-like superfamily protein [Carex rostrata]